MQVEYKKLPITVRNVYEMLSTRYSSMISFLIKRMQYDEECIKNIQESTDFLVFEVGLCKKMINEQYKEAIIKLKDKKAEIKPQIKMYKQMEASIRNSLNEARNIVKDIFKDVLNELYGTGVSIRAAKLSFEQAKNSIDANYKLPERQKLGLELNKLNFTIDQLKQLKKTSETKTIVKRIRARGKRSVKERRREIKTLKNLIKDYSKELEKAEQYTWT